MSAAAKSTCLAVKLLRPMTDEVTCQLMFRPYNVLAWPTHCWMATLAKLEPVDWRDGLAPAGVIPQSWVEPPSTTKAMIAAMIDAGRRRRLFRSAEVAVD